MKRSAMVVNSNAEFLNWAKEKKEVCEGAKSELKMKKRLNGKGVLTVKLEC